MLIIGCSGAITIAKSIAGRLGSKYQELYTDKFPDGELYLRYSGNIAKEEIILIQSFFGSINDKLMEIIFAGYTAKELGAKKATLVALYFPYLRQDKRFKSGEAVSGEITAKLIDGCFDKVIILDPHLHRTRKLTDVFGIQAIKLTAYPLIADYIKKKIKNPLIIGPDEESYRWAQNSAEQIGCEYAILQKKRFSSRHVKVMLNKKIDIGNKNLVLVDDMISTGHTILETIKNLKKLGGKRFTVLCVHGIFVEGALEKIRNAGAEVVACNTIPNKAAKIDVSGLVVEKLKNANYSGGHKYT